MNNKKPYFPEVDSRFLSQTESLILNGKAFRLSRDYPAYLNKLKLAKIKFIVINSKSISYSETEPTEVRPGSVMNIDEELSSLPGDFLTLAEPNIDVIRAVTGRALEAQGITIKNVGNRVFDNFFKSERLV